MWGRRGRGRGQSLGHGGRGHRLEAKVGEVEAVKWARSWPWGRSQRARGLEFEGEVSGLVGEGTEVGEVEGGVGIRDGGISS
jgi:hypothetical protein